MNSRIIGFHIVTLLILSGCGGGGGGGGGGTTNPPPSNSAPELVGLGSAGIVENTTDVGTYAATDPDNDTLSYSITGGVDGSLFSISTSGALTFDSAPDFENPTDTDGDNAYVVQVSASDGALQASLGIVVTVWNAVEGTVIDAPIRSANVFLDLNKDLIQDANEPDAQTNSLGEFSIPDLDSDCVDGSCDAWIVTEGGIDVVTGKDLTGVSFYSAASGVQNSFVTPFGSVLAEAADDAQVFTALGLNVTLDDVLYTDIWNDVDDATAETLLRLNQQLGYILLTAKEMGRQDLGITDAERAQNIFLELVNLAEDYLPQFDSLIRLDNKDRVNNLFQATQRRFGIGDDEEEFVAVSVAGINAVIADPTFDPVDDVASEVLSIAQNQMQLEINDLAGESINLQTFIDNTTLETLFENSRVFDQLPDTSPPSIESFVIQNQFPNTSSIAYTVADNLSGISQVAGTVTNGSCERGFSRSYSSSVQLSVTDSVDFEWDPKTKSGDYIFRSIDVFDNDGNSIDGLATLGEDRIFSVVNSNEDATSAELLSYTVTIDPSDASAVIVEMLVLENNGFSPNPLGEVSTNLDFIVHVLDETVDRFGYVGDSVTTADIIDNLNGTYTATTRHPLGSAVAANAAVLTYFRVCDAGLNLTELRTDALAPLLTP